MSTPIGFAGVGRMGGRLAARLAGDGCQVHAYDPDASALAALAEHGIATHATLAELTGAVDVIVLSLPGPSHVTSVASEIAGAPGTGGMTVIDTSTCGLEASRSAARTLAEAGIGFIDAPVSGGISKAADGTLAVMVGASDELFAKHEKILREIGSQLFHVGPDAGHGQVMKVVNNILSHGALALTSEAVTVATRAGVDIETAIATLNAGSGRNSATQDKFPRSVIPEKYNFGFTIRGSVKDSGLYLDSAKELGVDSVVGAAVVDAWRRAVDAGWGDEDFTAIYAMYAEQAANGGDR
ncbi:beta-hydroxyacid dehydrogenase, 3-hydroxyisobutyrate dehydrogenase [Prauserella sp. Am3]|nr:beta-hydroxyacid dehydrogenase, 3-hydroxyisobutyrate dehydrogenase [Prauserella sp. Am3]